MLCRRKVAIVLELSLAPSLFYTSLHSASCFRSSSICFSSLSAVALASLYPDTIRSSSAFCIAKSARLASAAIPNQGFALFGYGLEDVQQLEVGPALVYNESLVEPTISIEDIDDGVVDMVLMRPRFQRSTMEKPRRARERPT
ncbi:unnamed protein product [Prunus armeniaca]